jgi:hypothetical protein
MKQLNVSLDDDLREHVERAAKANGRSLGEEIRNRLAFAQAYDEKRASTPDLYKLLGKIEQIAPMISHRRRAEWHADANTNKIFATAVQNLIRDLNPPCAGEALTQEQIEREGKLVAEAYLMATALRADVSGRRTKGIFGLGTRSLIRPFGDGDDQNGLPDEAARIFARAASDATAELRRAGARPRRAEISGEGTPQGNVAKNPVKEGIAEGRSTKRRGKKR